MRAAWILLFIGLVLLIVGSVYAQYYASSVYPSERSKSIQSCERYNVSAGCVTLSPASDQGPFVLGEFAAGIGVVLLFLALVAFIWPRSRARRRPPQ
ncbi:MAG: hypothetical protein L3K23_10590 [Thermoplasmata archaeon]|nr:hypothetical protein [Thermoplasmata archaeon]